MAIDLLFTPAPTVNCVDCRVKEQSRVAADCYTLPSPPVSDTGVIDSGLIVWYLVAIIKEKGKQRSLYRKHH